MANGAIKAGPTVGQFRAVKSILVMKCNLDGLVNVTRPSALTPAAIRSQLGRKTSDEIRALVDERFDFNPEHLAWLSALAARMDALGVGTVNELPDDEFARVTAE